jgi:amino acid adenylation domain-containing protein
MQLNDQMRNLRKVVDAMAEESPEKEFLISAETGSSVSFHTMRQEFILIFRMLREAGLGPGDKIAFLMENGLLTAKLFLGAMYGGFVAVPLNVRAGATQLSYMLDHCDAKIVFVDEQQTQLLRESLAGVHRDISVIEVDQNRALVDLLPPGSEVTLEPLGAEDAALLMYSSGSTGKPKAAIHTHGSILAHGRNSIAAHQLTSADRSLLVLPLYHINAECVTLIPTLLSGGSIVITHRFVVSKFWDWIDDFQVTWSALVPTIISDLVDWNDPRKVDRQAAFDRIRFFRSSSAPLAPSLHRQFLDKFNLPLLQAMGSTECGNVFSNPQPPGANKIGSPGLAWGFEARIADRQGVDVPRGQSGEVLLRGPGLMKAYYKDPEGTAAVVDGDGWLHTGDLARQDDDGYYFVVGRSKELIIKGGVNIAPRQIDEVLESHSAVLEAAAVGVPDRYFGEDVIAFVTLRQDADADERELLAFCETRLGHFKTPSRIHFLKELPKGPSGKVQRLRLLDPALLSAVGIAEQSGGRTVPATVARNATNGGFVPEACSVEQIIAAAWAEVLGVPQVEVDRNFFALGGHSLLAIQCISKLREKLPVVLSLSEFFETGTVAEQADLIRRRLRPADSTNNADGLSQPDTWEKSLLQQYAPSAEEKIPHLDSNDPYPLSPAQQRLWFLEKLNPGIPVYNEAEAVRLTGELNVEALEQALNIIVSRHGVLRSTIEEIDGVPHAVIHENWPLRFKRIDLSGLPATDRESQLERLLIDEPKAPYALEKEPGVRVSIIRQSPHEHVLILMMHHIICDWSSEGIIWRELSLIYKSLLYGALPELPALPVTHRDFAIWQETKLTSDFLKEQLDFWEETLRGAPALLELPADRSRPPEMSYRGGRLRRKLSNSLTESLRELSRREKASLFTVFAAGLDTLFYRYTGTDDILIGLPLADRDLPELQSVVGFLLHTHVLRTKLSGGLSFRELLSCVQKEVFDLYAHRAAPFDQIVKRIRPERNLSHTPLFQVMLNWRDRDQQLAFIGLEGLTIESLMAASNASKFDLFFFVTDSGEEIWLELEYNSDLFDEDRIARMLGHYQSLLERVAVEPEVIIASLQLTTAAEKEQLLLEWNRTGKRFPTGICLDQLIEDQIRRTPNSIAAVCGRHRMSYRQLGEQADRIAAYLREFGIGRGSLVAICFDRSLDMLAALLGVWKTGAAYLPLDPSFPSDRLAFMMEDAQVEVMLTQVSLRGRLQSLKTRIVCFEDIPRKLNPSLSAEGSYGRNDEDLAYVLYTSGSTGRPKGVEIQHRALVNFMLSMRLEPGISSNDKLLAITTLSFDISGLELFLPLIAGARVVLASKETTKDSKRLSALIRESGATIMQATPVTWRMLLDSGWEGSLGLKALCGGEAWNGDLAREILPRCASLWNMYGPTETTIWSSVSRVERDLPVRIGKPIANTTFYVLDPFGHPQPVGVPGELFIGGSGLARGYLGRIDLTKERFVPDPFSKHQSARLYKTGDLVRRLGDGSIEFLNRLDNQIKLRGFRIELDEIEKSVKELRGVRQCVVAVREVNSAEKRLVAYIVPDRPPTLLWVEDLRRALKDRLPEYMIPGEFALIDEVPLTPNGKIDRKALTKSPVATALREDTSEPPRDFVEQKLAQIWESMLDVNPIGIRTNFFEIGGYSLLAIKLFAEVERVFRRPLPVATIFESPTIERLAKLIRGHALDISSAESRKSSVTAGSDSSVFPIRPEGSGAPLFIIHGVEGHIIGFHRLASLIGTSHPIYGIQAQAMLRGKSGILRLEDQAAYYLSEIQRIQPQGPYYLLGYCFGGTVAFEIAQQLRASGERVQLLGLLDARQRDCLVSFQRSEPLQARLGHRMEGFLGAFSRLSLGQRIAFLPGKLLARILRLIYSLAPKCGFRTVPSFMKRTEDILLIAASHYQAKAWPGSVTLFRAADQAYLRLPQDLGWGTLAKGGVEVFEIPGNHYAVFQEPNVDVLAQRLREKLRQVDANAGMLSGELASVTG